MASGSSILDSNVMAGRFPRSLKSHLPWIGSSVATLLISALILVLAISLEPTDAQCVRQSFSWSPALDAIKYRYETFANIDFFTESPYFGLVPTQEIEDAWGGILPKHPISIPTSKLEALGQRLDSDDPDWIRDPHNPDAVLAIPEYAAQLGCLNFLRQWSYSPGRDFRYLASHLGSKDLIWRRTHQCLERLREAVMCWADTGVLIKYFPENPEPGQGLMFDLGTYHYCRDFDKIHEWTEEHAVEHVKMDNLWWSGDEDTNCKVYDLCFD